MIINNPLTLAIICMIVGMVAGAALAALAVMISNDLHKDDISIPSNYLTNEDLEELGIWYDAICEQKGAHEK